MTQTLPTSTTPDERTPERASFGEMLEELIDLGAGLSAIMMPLLLLAMPGIILFVVLPGILLLALAVPLALVAALIAAPPYLIRRWLRRRRRPPAKPAAGRADRALLVPKALR